MQKSACALRALLRYRFMPSGLRPKLSEVASHVGVYKSQLSEWSRGERLIPRRQIADLVRTFLRLKYPEPLVRGLLSAWLLECGLDNGLVVVQRPLTIHSFARADSL